VKGQYTDNVFLTEDKDLKEDDFITTVSPGFGAEIQGKNSGAKISYDAAYAKYDKWDIFDGWRHHANLSAWSQVTKHTHLGVRDNFVYTEDPIRDENLAEIRTEDPNIPIDSTVRKARRIYYQNFADIKLNHQYGKYDSNFKLGYSHWFRDEDDPNLEDKQYHLPSVGLTHWFSLKYGFDINTSYTKGEFEDSDDLDIYRGNVSFLNRFTKQFIGYLKYSHTVADYRGESEDDITYNPSVGIRYDIEKDISLIADVGYFYNDYEFRESQSAVSGDLRLIKLFEHGRLNLAVLGGYDYSFFGTEDLGYEVYYEASASLTHQLAKHVHGRIFGSYRHSKYTDRSDRKDKRPTVGARLTWQAFEWMDIGLDYRFRSVDSTIDTNDYDENRVSVSFTVFPTVPFHTSRY